VFEELQPGVFAAACYNGTGVTRATLLGRLIAEYAAGERSELVDLALSIEKPPRIPPTTLFRPPAALRFHFEHKMARPER
jgi:glycine/D-amino acid oxidase-like deaminating enzyme